MLGVTWSGVNILLEGGAAKGGGEVERDLRSLRLWGRVDGGGGEGGVVGGGLAPLALRERAPAASLARREREPAGLTVNVTIWSAFMLALSGKQYQSLSLV